MAAMNLRFAFYSSCLVSFLRSRWLNLYPSVRLGYQNLALGECIHGIHLVTLLDWMFYAGSESSLFDLVHFGIPMGTAFGLACISGAWRMLFGIGKVCVCVCVCVSLVIVEACERCCRLRSLEGYIS